MSDAPLIIYGAHPVEEILLAAPDKARRVLALDWDAPAARPIAALADAAGVRRDRATRDELDRLCEGGNHQGVALVGKPFNYAQLDVVLKRVADEPLARLLVLDGIQDVGNLGAILRSAAALGVAAVIVPKKRAAGVTPAAVRASAGQALRVPVVRVTNLARTLDALKEAGFWVVGSALDPEGTSTQAPWEVDMAARIALVVGSEHKGMRPLVARGCDLLVQIPMTPGVESMNAAAAAATLMYEASRQGAAKRANDSLE